MTVEFALEYSPAAGWTRLRPRLTSTSCLSHYYQKGKTKGGLATLTEGLAAMRVERSKPLEDFSGEEPCAKLDNADTACARVGCVALNAPKRTAEEGDLEVEVILFLM